VKNLETTLNSTGQAMYYTVTLKCVRATFVAMEYQ